MQIGDRLVGSDQLSSPSYIRDGHVSHDQVSGSSGHVGDVVGLVRRLPSCPHPGRMSKIPVLVLVLPFALNSGPWAFTEDNFSTVDSVSISGRLIEPSSDKHGTVSSTMPTSGPASEREVGADALAGHRVSGREARFSAGQGISVGDQ